MGHSEDPWERRAAERERFRKRARRRSHELDPDSITPDDGGKARVACVLVGVLLLLLSGVPWLPPRVGTVLAVVGAAGVFVLLSAWRDYAEGWGDALRRPVNLALLALLLWGGVCYLRSPFRVQASVEMLRLLGGAGIFWYGAYALRAGRERALAAAGLLAIGVAMAAADFLRYSQSPGSAGSAAFHANAVTFFGTHESVGSLLAVLVALAAAFAFVGDVPARPRLAAQAATLVLGFAWIVARCRSAWVGGILGLIALGLLLWQASRERARRKDGVRGWLSGFLESPLPVIVGALVFLVAFGGLLPQLSARLEGVARSLEGGSLVARWDMWRGAMQMLAERPAAGFGLGGYLVLQGDWTHHGNTSWEVLRDGTTLVNLAHNYYLQWAADTGVVGLAAHLAFVAALLHALVSAGRRTRGMGQALVLAGAAGCVSLGVTALGSPSFHLPGIWAAGMLVLGLAFGASRDGGSPRERRIGALAAALGAVVGALVGAGLVWAGRPDPSPGPRGTWQLKIDAPGGFRAGQTVTWRASFTDARGRAQSTFPGTQWREPALVRVTGRATGAEERRAAPLDAGRYEAQGRRKNYQFADAEFKVRLPESVPAGERWEVWVSAAYRDAQGRRYEAMTVAPVEP